MDTRLFNRCMERIVASGWHMAEPAPHNDGHVLRACRGDVHVELRGPDLGPLLQALAAFQPPEAS